MQSINTQDGVLVAAVITTIVTVQGLCMTPHSSYPDQIMTFLLSVNNLNRSKIQ